MTVSKDYNKHIYEGNGLTVDWPYDFDLPITAAGTPDTSLIHVFRTNLRGEVTEVTAFSVDAETGTLTYPTSGSPLESGEKLTILRLLDISQQFFDPSNQANLYPETLEDNTDRLVMMLQQLQEETDRAVKVSVSTDLETEDITAEGIFEARDIALSAATASEGWANTFPAIADELDVNIVLDEADLRAKLAAIGASNASLVIATTIPIAADLAIPSNVALSFKRAGQLQPAVGTTLTINGAIDAGLWQIFSGLGTITGLPQIPTVYPEWFGALGNSINDDAEAIQTAINLCNTVVLDSDKTYLLGSIIFLYDNTQIIGNGCELIHGINTPDYGPLLWIVGSNVKVENLTIHNTVNNISAVGASHPIYNTIFSSNIMAGWGTNLDGINNICITGINMPDGDLPQHDATRGYMGICIYGNTTSVNIENCTMTGAFYMPIACEWNLGVVGGTEPLMPSFITINNCIIKEYGYEAITSLGIHLSSVRGVSISNCIIEAAEGLSSGAAINLSLGDKGASDGAIYHSSICNNTVKNATALIAIACTRTIAPAVVGETFLLDITNNYLADGSIGIRLYGPDGGGIKITGNRFENLVMFGIQASQLAASVDSFQQGLWICNNYFSSITWNAVRLEKVSNALISGNQFKECGNTDYSVIICTAPTQNNIITNNVFGSPEQIDLPKYQVWLLRSGTTTWEERPQNNVICNNIFHRTLTGQMIILSQAANNADAFIAKNYVYGNVLACGGRETYGAHPWVKVGSIDICLSPSTTIPSVGTWRQGDSVRVTYPIAAAPIEYVCLSAGTFGTAASNATTVNASNTLINVANTGVFTVGDFITIPTGFATTGPFQILAIGVNQITVDATATSDSTVTITTLNPTFKSIIL